MAASKVEICNLALLRLGQRSIQSLDEKSEEAGWCKKLYDRTRKTMLRDFPWRFALKVETLALVDSDPVGYENAYAIPSDCLRAVDIVSSYTNSQAEFERFGNEIWTDEPNAQMRYIRDVQDPNEFDEGFVESLAWRLAADLAMPLTRKQELLQSMMNGYMISRSAGQAVAAGESRKRTSSMGSSIKDSRL